MEKCYDEITMLFEGKDPTLSDFLVDVSERINAKEKKKLDEVFAPSGDLRMAYTAIMCTCRALSFAAGYVFGQMFDICDEEAETAAEELKQRIIDEGILNYWPRDKVKKSAKVLEVYKKLEELTDFIESNFDLSKE